MPFVLKYNQNYVSTCPSEEEYTARRFFFRYVHLVSKYAAISVRDKDLIKAIANAAIEYKPIRKDDCWDSSPDGILREAGISRKTEGVPYAFPLMIKPNITYLCVIVLLKKYQETAFAEVRALCEKFSMMADYRVLCGNFHVALENALITSEDVKISHRYGKNLVKIDNKALDEKPSYDEETFSENPDGDKFYSEIKKIVREYICDVSAELAKNAYTLNYTHDNSTICTIPCSI